MSTPPETAAFLAQSRVPQILVGTIVPAGIASIFAFARFYSRAVIMKNWGIDDTFILISWFIGTIILTTLNCMSTNYGSGHHSQANENMQSMRMGMKIGFLCRLFYQVCLGTTKIGICLFYRRIFQDQGRRSIIFVWGMVAFISAYSIPMIITVLFSCKPIQGAWTPIHAKCIDNTTSLYTSVTLNIVADVALLVFVVPKIVALRISRVQKALLLAIVCMVVLVIAASIIRLDQILVTLSSKDQSWDSYRVAIWSSVEINTGLVCASAASIKPLLRKLAPLLPSWIWQPSQRAGSVPTFGAGAPRSRRDQTDGGFELGTQPDLETCAGDSTTVGTFWGKKKQGNMSDNDSETGVSRVDANGSEILKTVSLSVTESNGDLEASRNNSVSKLEHV